MMFSFKCDRNANQSDDRLLSLFNPFAITPKKKKEKKKAKNITKIDRLQSNLDNSAINSHGYGLKVGGICLNDDIYSQCNSHIDNSQLQFNLLITEAALFFCVQML